MPETIGHCVLAESVSTHSAGSSSSEGRTFRPYGYGQLFPSYSPRSSGAGDSNLDWTMAEEKILRDVAQWLSPADLRRSRLVCTTWYEALATLTTRATTPAESMVPQWKGQLEAMLQAFPGLQQLTISSRLSSVAAQQLGVLATAKRLQVLNMPQAQALQDRSLLALQPMAGHLRELRISGASGLSRRSLLLLSVLANLEVLELKNCGKISWFELQQAWKAACSAYEAQVAAEAAAGANQSSSGGGSGRFSSSGGGLGSKLGAWLPSGRLFRTSSPSSNAIQSAVAWQRHGTNSLLTKVHDLARGTSNAAAVAVAQLGIGAVGNGRSSCGGSMPDDPARSLLYRKQKGDAVPVDASQPRQQEDSALDVDALGSTAGGCFPMRSGLSRIRARSAITADEHSPRPTSVLSRVGSLMWSSSSGASAGTSSSLGSFVGSSSATLAAQTSCVQAALMALIAKEGRSAGDELPTGVMSVSGTADPAAKARKEVLVNSTMHGRVAATVAACPEDASNSVQLRPEPAQQHGSKGGSALAASSQCSAARYKPSRRTTGDKALPAMPFTKLTELSFTCTDTILKSPVPELAAVAALTSLKSLEVSKCKLPDVVFVHLQALSKLSKLKLTGLWSMGDVGLQHIAQVTSLKSLALSEAMHVTADGLQAMSSLTALTSLALGFTQDFDPGRLACVINTLPLLQCIEIAAPSWGDLDCEMLSEAASVAHDPSPACRLSTANSASVSTGAMQATNDTEQRTPGAASCSSVPASSAAPIQMLWDVPGLLSNGTSSRLASRASSSRQLLAPVSRHSGGFRMRSASYNSLRSISFTSFTMAAAAQPSPTATLPAQPLFVLRLHGCRSLGSKGLAALKNLPELHTLVLDNCQAVRAAEIISQGYLPSKLTSLALRGLPFGNTFSSCVTIPCCSSQLKRLELNALEGAHNGQLRRLFDFFPQVTELSLAGCSEVGDPAIQHLLLMPKLQRLSLSGCSIVQQGLEHLQHLPQLETLNLRACNQLTDEGLAHLSGCPMLSELDVSDCAAISEQGVLQVARRCPRLVRLDVSGCRNVSRSLLIFSPHYIVIKHSL